ncbi:hypothetical protein LshimejAT787_0306240 [Lyophyllum shimeji]|uniref:Uncharacterized protein n=1 Tax=Lyophyllum shimeji TaxID=47721 RepID=A0A9P3PID4_LYOSH|nr:hypothetical protein LshimejAT787_0306240 [Lyophyllum shimeji]
MPVGINSEDACPAGPGAQLNREPSNSHSIATFCGSPYVSVQKISGAESSNGRASRSPMMDRTNKTETSRSYLSSAKHVKLLLSRGDFLDQTPSRCGHYTPATSFQPLPPLSCTSSLQLPSFIKTPTRTTSLPLDLGSHPLTPASVAVPKQSITPGGISPPLAASVEPNKLLVNVNIPSFMHPNSPYVPWTPEVRREVLCPYVAPSPVSDFYTCPYSHTVAQAPKPEDLDASLPLKGFKISKLSRSLRNLTSIIGKNIKQAAKQISGVKKSQTATVPQAPASCDHAHMSTNSFDSSDATRLSTWLRNCQQARLDREGEVSRGVSLDEYERLGSWTKLPGVKATPNNENQYLEATLASQRSRRQTRPAHTSGGSLPRSLSRFYSHSDSQLVGSLRISSRSPEDAYAGTLSKRDRELSMPGGWTFAL